MKHKSLKKKAFDPRTLPAYYPGIAAHCLDLPMSTLRSWFFGRRYRTKDGKSHNWGNLLEPASSEPFLLSFLNLVECHTLSIIRFGRGIKIPAIRYAIQYLEEVSGPHPLANHEFLTSERDLYAQMMGQAVNASRGGQTALPEVVSFFLTRIERDDDALASRFYPILRPSAAGGRLDLEAPKAVVIDPRISFGRPAITGTRIPVDVIAERVRAGEQLSGIAQDVRCDTEKIEQALRWELRQEAA